MVHKSLVVGGKAMHVRSLLGLGALSALAAGALVYLEPAPGTPGKSEIASPAVAKAEAHSADEVLEVTTVIGPPVQMPESITRPEIVGAVAPELTRPGWEREAASSTLLPGPIADPRGGRLHLNIPGLLARANELIHARDVAAARMLLEYATPTKQPEVWIALAKTYDPVKLAEWNATGAGPDLERSRQLYATARALLDSRNPKPALEIPEDRALWAGLIFADRTQVQAERN
jgi:hypothetical protein